MRVGSVNPALFHRQVIYQSTDLTVVHYSVKSAMKQLLGIAVVVGLLTAVDLAILGTPGYALDNPTVGAQYQTYPSTATNPGTDPYSASFGQDPFLRARQLLWDD